jgi:hypothetical protein
MITNLNKYSADLFRAGRAYQDILSKKCSESNCASCTFSPNDDGFFSPYCPPVLFDLKVKTPADLRRFMDECKEACGAYNLSVGKGKGILTPDEVAELLGAHKPIEEPAMGEIQGSEETGYRSPTALRELKVIQGGR